METSYGLSCWEKVSSLGYGLRIRAAVWFPGYLSAAFTVCQHSISLGFRWGLWAGQFATHLGKVLFCGELIQLSSLLVW